MESAMITIQSDAIYASSWEDDGCFVARRYYSGGREYKIGEPWPALAVGQEIEVETTNHYTWRGTVEEIRDEDTVVFRASAPKVAMPLPPVVDGQPYVLPYSSGDAWSTRPEAGKVLLIQDQPYKVVGRPKDNRGKGGGYIYVLRPVEASAYATRRGRVKITDLTDPNPGSLFSCEYNVGRVIKLGEEYLHVTKVERVAYGDGEGREIFGYNTFGVGRFVAAEQATKLSAAWERAKEIRSVEHSIKVASQDLDYGGHPDALPALRAKLEALKAGYVVF